MKGTASFKKNDSFSRGGTSGRILRPKLGLCLLISSLPNSLLGSRVSAVVGGAQSRAAKYTGGFSRRGGQTQWPSLLHQPGLLRAPLSTAAPVALVNAAPREAHDGLSIKCVCTRAYTSVSVCVCVDVF